MGLKFEPKKFKFGMRTLKTGLAVFLVLGLFSALGWEGLQIGCLTAVFSLRENFDRSIQFGKSRIFANTVGGLLSLLLCEYVVSSFSLGDLAIGSNFDNVNDCH